MKYFIVSDLHSNLTPLLGALKENNFDEKKDTLVVLGDVFDRGKESVELYSYLTSLKHLILVRGNHEDLLKTCINSGCLTEVDYMNGTVRTIISFVGRTKGWADKFKKHPVWKWLNSKRWKNYIELGDYILTHAGLPIDYKECKDNREWEYARWNNPIQFKEDGLIPEGKTLICGHWFAYLFKEYFENCEVNPKKFKDIYKKDNIIAIDSCAVLSNHINVLIYDTKDDKIYYKGKEI